MKPAGTGFSSKPQEDVEKIPSIVAASVTALMQKTVGPKMATNVDSYTP